MFARNFKLLLALVVLVAPVSAGDRPASSAPLTSSAAKVFAASLDGGFTARHPNKDWDVRFDGRGASVRPDTGWWSWGLELQSYGFGGAESPVESPLATTVEGSRLSYQWSEALDEWYVKDERGLEHGFTLRARPSAGAGPLRFVLGLRGSLLPIVQADARGVRFWNTDGVAMLAYAGLVVFDATGAELDARFHLEGSQLVLSIEEAAATYPLTIDPIVQAAYLKASNPGSGDRFGNAIALSGDTLVVAARSERSAATGVDGDQSDNSASNAGAAYVFVRSGKTWSQQAYLKASNTDSGDYFGSSVAISGDTIVIGATAEDSSATGVGGDESKNDASQSGAAYVFQRSGMTWTQSAYLKAVNTGSPDMFGTSVAIAADTIAVGAIQENSAATGINGDPFNDLATNAGAVYLFERSGATWIPGDYVKASNTNSGDHFGISVALDGDVLVVGARYEASAASGVDGDQTDNSIANSGAAYVFGRTAGVWSQEAYLKASSPSVNETFGGAVTVSGDTVVVGAPIGGALFQGEAFVFTRNGTTWSHQADLVPAPLQSGILRFAATLSLSGERLLVGAYNDKSGVPGVNANPLDQSQNAAGAAHLFVRTGTAWTKEAYFKAPAPGFLDLFGSSCSLSGDTAVVSAPRDDSAAAGVDGDPTDDSLFDAGGVVVFDLAAPSGAQRYGTYSATNSADLTSSTPPVSGSPFNFELSRFQTAGPALLLISLAPTAFFDLGGLILVNPSLSIFGPGGMLPVALSGGSGQLSLPIPAGTQGLSVYAQAIAWDPNLTFNWAFTNGLAVTVGP